MLFQKNEPGQTMSKRQKIQLSNLRTRQFIAPFKPMKPARPLPAVQETHLPPSRNRRGRRPGLFDVMTGNW